MDTKRTLDPVLYEIIKNPESTLQLLMESGIEKDEAENVVKKLVLKGNSIVLRKNFMVEFSKGSSLGSVVNLQHQVTPQSEIKVESLVASAGCSEDPSDTSPKCCMQTCLMSVCCKTT